MAANKSSTKHEPTSSVKYEALTSEDMTAEHGVDTGEELALLDNMESMRIRDVVTARPAVGKHENCMKDVIAKSPTPSTMDGRKPLSQDEVLKTNRHADVSVTSKDIRKNTIPVNDGDDRAIKDIRTDEIEKKETDIERNVENTQKPCSSGPENRDVSDELDIVRKMSNPSGETYLPWRKIGLYSVLKQKSCQRIYAMSGREDDLALFYVNGMFYVMDAWCSHMGGPLFEGDIEDYNGQCHVMCPWHSYMFDLKTGMNELGLEQNVYELKLDQACVYVRYKSEVSIAPTRKASEVKKPKVIQPPNRNKENPRKDSVLENVMRL